MCCTKGEIILQPLVKKKKKFTTRMKNGKVNQKKLYTHMLKRYIFDFWFDIVLNNY